jgi:acetate kinase
LNSGSSSLKFGVYALGDHEEALEIEGAAERIGLGGGRLWIRTAAGESIEDTRRSFPAHRDAVETLLRALETHRMSRVDAAGHRVVHGGPHRLAPERVSPALLADLAKLVPFAPLHLPSEIDAIEAVEAAFHELPQVACFDTAFHRRMPEVAQRLPLPRSLWEEGLRRYGFHGLSYEYVLHELSPAPDERIVIAHLGNGASMAAVRGEQPLDTTMGLTPTGGFMMGTRSGDLDPGVLLYLIEQKGYDAPRLDDIVNREAGLAGVSGITSDMRSLLEKRSRDPHAAQAVEMFCYQVRKHLGALAAVLGGLDTLVFTGGIGERAAPVREAICRDLEHLGVNLDAVANDADADTISRSGAPCSVRVIPTKEDLMIARHTRRLIFGSTG